MQYSVQLRCKLEDVLVNDLQFNDQWNCLQVECSMWLAADHHYFYKSATMLHELWVSLWICIGSNCHMYSTPCKFDQIPSSLVPWFDSRSTPNGRWMWTAGALVQHLDCATHVLYSLLFSVGSSVFSPFLGMSKYWLSRIFLCRISGDGNFLMTKFWINYPVILGKKSHSNNNFLERCLPHHPYLAKLMVFLHQNVVIPH
jgi:hypothetical protein